MSSSNCWPHTEQLDIESPRLIGFIVLFKKDASTVASQELSHLSLNKTINPINLGDSMSNCSVCGQQFDDDIRFLNHMMEKHGFRNPNIDKPDRNSRGY